MSDEVNLVLTALSLLGAAAAGFLAGREWRKKHFDQQLLKETYEKGKLDGAYEYLRNSMFATLSKHQPENAGSAGGHKKPA